MEEPRGTEPDRADEGPAAEVALEPAVAGRTRRPRALWAVLAVVAVAAGALVVTSADDEGDQSPGLPVDLAGASRLAGGGAEAAADSMLAWLTYVPGDDLPSLGGEAAAYRLSGDVTEDQVQGLAEALALDGPVRRTDSGWSVTGDGGVGRLEVFVGAGAHWSYFSGEQDCLAEDGGVTGCYSECSVDSSGVERCASGGSAGCAEPDVASDAAADCGATTTTAGASSPGATSGMCVAEPDVAEQQPCDDVASIEQGDTGSDCAQDDCAPPEPADPPNDVAQVALDVVAGAGLDVDGARVEALTGASPNDPSATWYLTVEPRLAGVPSGLVSYIEVSSDRRVLTGGGVFGLVEELGEYPVLDTYATIERANEQTASYANDAPALGAPEATSSTTGGTDTADADTTGDADVVLAPTTTGVGATEPGTDPGTDPGADPCAVPEGAPADGCGGTTGCGGDGCAEPPTTSPCKLQPDGREICEVVDSASATAEGTAGTDGSEGVVEIQPCEVPTDPEPVEIVLIDAEPSLVLLPANDGSADAYLVPAYRFTVEDGGSVDLPAVDDDALTGPGTTDTTVTDTVLPAPVPEPQPCEILEEQDPNSATTHTVQTCPSPNEDPTILGDGEEPVVGVGYYVDVDKKCAAFRLGGRVWTVTDGGETGWADPSERHEGGTFTLDAPDHGTFVGDAEGRITGTFRPAGPDSPAACDPEPRA